MGYVLQLAHRLDPERDFPEKAESPKCLSDCHCHCTPKNRAIAGRFLGRWPLTGGAPSTEGSFAAVKLRRGEGTVDLDEQSVRRYAEVGDVRNES